TPLDAYDVAGTLTLENSTVHGLAIDRGTVESTLRESTLSIARFEASGPAIAGRGSGSLTLTDRPSIDFTYDIDRADVGQLQALTGREIGGVVTTKGRVSGSLDAARAIGDATTTDLDAFDVYALTMNGAYDVTLPLDGGEGAAAAQTRVNGRATFVNALGIAFEEASGTITFDASKLGFDLTLSQAGGRHGQIAGSAIIESPKSGETDVTLLDLTLTLGREPWRLAKIDVRLEQSPGIWLTAAGSLPMGLFDASLPEAPMDVDIKSSSIDLGLVEGVTNVVQKVSGRLELNVKAIGTSRDPHFAGSV